MLKTNKKKFSQVFLGKKYVAQHREERAVSCGGKGDLCFILLQTAFLYKQLGLSFCTGLVLPHLPCSIVTIFFRVDDKDFHPESVFTCFCTVNIMILTQDTFLSPLNILLHGALVSSSLSPSLFA